MSEPTAGPALPGAECPVAPHEGWSELERWVWQEVGSGRIADINRHLGWTADPKQPEDWGPERRLTPAFLEAILLHDPWRSAIPRQGVRIIGALFDEKVDLENAELQCQLWLDDCRFTADVSFRGMHAARFISLAGSACAGALDVGLLSLGNHLNLNGAKVTGLLNMEAASIGGLLLISEGAEFAEVNLVGAKVKGQLNLSRAKVMSTLNMESASIGADLLMSDSAEFAEVTLGRAKIGGALDLSGAKVTGTLDMDVVSVSGTLFMSDRARFAEIKLGGANIGGQLDLTGAKVTGALYMDSASVGADLIMREGAKFTKEINLIFAAIDKNLWLHNATFAHLDLTGTRVQGELHLASQGRRANWGDDASLKLRNVHVDAIQDEPEAWPAKLDLDGFTYSRFGGFGADPAKVIEERGSQWFVDWLEKDKPYTPQPYEQCAKVLREMGHPEMANDVLYAGRERERKQLRQQAWSPRNYARRLGLWFLRSTIGYGYGYRYFRSLWWVAGLVLFGALLLGATDEYLKIPDVIAWSAASWQSVFYNCVDLIAYNFDILLPIIELQGGFEEVDLSAPIRYYFHFEKIMGYVLASFLIAGLSGLTK